MEDGKEVEEMIREEKIIEAKPASHKKGSLTRKMKENPWIIATLVLGVLFLIMLIGNGGMTGGIVGVSRDEAGQAVVDFATAQGVAADLVSVEEENNFYKVTLSLEGQEFPLYVTKDGEYFASALTPLSAQAPPRQTPSQQQPPAADVPKTDKPVVELFVMTHCPYGTQAEKGFIPAILELGDSIDPSIKFVHYFLHDPENDETPIQVCIREEQPDKFNAYLKCFLEDGDSDRCVIEANIDKAKMETCVSGGKADEYYAADSALSEGYGVRGSPTLVVNGVIANSGRSADAYLNTICSAFNTAPDACNSQLDTQNPSPGFGYGTTTGIANAQC